MLHHIAMPRIVAAAIGNKPVHGAAKASDARATRYFLNEIEETLLIHEEVQDREGWLVMVHAEVDRRRMRLLVNAFVEDSLVCLTLDELQKTRLQELWEDNTVLLLECSLQTFQIFSRACNN